MFYITLHYIALSTRSGARYYWIGARSVNTTVEIA